MAEVLNISSRSLSAAYLSDASCSCCCFLLLLLPPIAIGFDAEEEFGLVADMTCGVGCIVAAWGWVMGGGGEANEVFSAGRGELLLVTTLLFLLVTVWLLLLSLLSLEKRLAKNCSPSLSMTLFLSPPPLLAPLTRAGQ